MTVLGSITYVEPWWMQILKSLVIFLVVFNFVPVALMADRKVLGRFQQRYGPNRVGPFGSLQPIADILKLLGKEDFRTWNSVAFLHRLAPILSVIAAAGVLAVVPFGLLQAIADIGKLVFKAQFRPTDANGWLFAVAPVISMMTAAATRKIRKPTSCGPTIQKFVSCHWTMSTIESEPTIMIRPTIDRPWATS